ncbi:hypothetical protein EYF80_057745 [Liparis tanakae]|uniref:Uncharacterized protein n=1 Tax=Liparis tanakae TaxID=230148 RepID=A0A4Z2ET67_9TELE|nr:hypothetical protein EYF80_057745 [Liparis tanakae]
MDVHLQRRLSIEATDGPGKSTDGTHAVTQTDHRGAAVAGKKRSAGPASRGPALHTIPRLTVSLTRPPSSSSRSVSAESRDVAAIRRPKARWDEKRSDTSSASVCTAAGITTFMYMLPSNDRTDASGVSRERPCSGDERPAPGGDGSEDRPGRSAPPSCLNVTAPPSRGRPVVVRRRRVVREDQRGSERLRSAAAERLQIPLQLLSGSELKRKDSRVSSEDVNTAHGDPRPGDLMLTPQGELLGGKRPRKGGMCNSNCRDTQHH